jgi:hypothetical protein
MFARNILFTFTVCLSLLPSVRIKLVRFSKVKLLVGFQPNFTALVISTIPSCAYTRLHVLLCLTKWLQRLKIEKPCPAFTGQTAGGISTTL